MGDPDGELFEIGRDPLEIGFPADNGERSTGDFAAIPEIIHYAEPLLLAGGACRMARSYRSA
jgi:hypothetical protein